MKRSRKDSNHHLPSKLLKTKPRQSPFLPFDPSASNPVKSHKLTHVYRSIHTLTGHDGPVTSAKYSPNGSLLATSSSDCTVKLWHPQTATLVATLSGHTQGVSSIAWSPDSKFVASASDDKTIRVWEVPTILEKEKIRNLQKMFKSLSSMPNVDFVQQLEDVKNQLGLSDDDCDVDLNQLLLDYQDYDTINTDEQKNTNDTNDKTIKQIPDQQNTPYVFGTPKLRRILRGHTHHVTCVSYNLRGNLLVSGSSDENLRIWDIRGGKCLRTLAAHSDPVTSVEFSCDGTLVASGSQDGLIRLWDTRTGQCLKTLVAGFATRSNKNRSHDENNGSDTEGEQKEEQEEQKKGTEENPNAANAVMMIKFTPNSKYLLAGTLDAELRMWDYMSDKVAKTYQPQQLRLTPNGSPQHLQKPKETGSESNCVNEEVLATHKESASANSQTSHQPTVVIDTHKYSSLAVFVRNSRYGTLVARGTGEFGDILFWNLQTREVVDVLDTQTANGHSDVVLGLDIHPDENIQEMASASRDGTCKIWVQEELE